MSSTPSFWRCWEGLIKNRNRGSRIKKIKPVSLRKPDRLFFYSLAFRLEGLNVLSLQTLGALFNGEFNLLVLAQ
jgi:hypothetical protein